MRSSHATKIEWKKKPLDWQLFKNIEPACKYDLKMNKSQRVLTSENLLPVDGSKLRAAFVKGGGVLI